MAAPTEADRSGRSVAVVGGGFGGLPVTGSYPTPGIGVPTCLVSGQLTADAVAEDHGR